MAMRANNRAFLVFQRKKEKGKKIFLCSLFTPQKNFDVSTGKRAGGPFY